MSQLLAYLFLVCAIIIGIIPVIGYIKSKYYYVDTTPIRYWLNRNNKIKKRYRTFKKRNKKHLTTSKISRYYSYGKRNIKAGNN